MESLQEITLPISNCKVDFECKTPIKEWFEKTQKFFKCKSYRIYLGANALKSVSYEIIQSFRPLELLIPPGSIHSNEIETIIIFWSEKESRFCLIDETNVEIKDTETTQILNQLEVYLPKL